MISKCPNCGCQVVVKKNGTSGMVTGIGMLLVVAVGGFVLWEKMSENTSHDTAVISNHIGTMGQ